MKIKVDFIDFLIYTTLVKKTKVGREMFLNQLINAVIQVVIFSIIPLIWWLITARKKENFLKWIGLKKPESNSKKELLISFLVILVGCFLIGQFAIWIRGDVEAAESAYNGMGLKALPCVLVYSYIQTGLSEEILFRGFLLKRLMAKFGFVAATVIQALIFGVIHLTMVWGKVGIVAGIVIVVYPMIPAVAFSYLNEKKANGSIIPSWIIHGSINTLTTLLSLF